MKITQKEKVVKKTDSRFVNFAVLCDGFISSLKHFYDISVTSW